MLTISCQFIKDVLVQGYNKKLKVGLRLYLRKTLATTSFVVINTIPKVVCTKEWNMTAYMYLDRI